MTASRANITTESAVPGRGRRFFAVVRHLFNRPVTAFGTCVFLVFVLMALIGPWLAPYSENEQIYTDARQAPSSEHWFGTDNLGRDVYSRGLYGAREVLAQAGLGTILAVICGTFFGLVTGYRGGWLDELTMRLFDSLLALPALLLALLLLGTVGQSRNAVLIVIVVVYTPIVARVGRSVVLSVRTKGFVEAAQLQGESQTWILFREILPSVVPALTVEGALRFSYAIFLVASLGFLGVGVQPPSPNWGLMVSEARTHASQLPWALFFPAAAIALLVIGVNLMADGIKNTLQSAD
ncbi:MAG: ABC transporter permease [Anaerolineaceae bacterium]|nr:MAG: ABC transporter permease [Anaerolineaceae bacterium]